MTISPEELCDAIREAAGRAHLEGDAGDGETIEMRFGEQVHTRVLTSDQNGELRAEQVAAYVAKYSCKSSHEQITSRDDEPDRWRKRGVPEQLVQMAAAALRLSDRPGLLGLKQWVHMLGFRGHFVTKSRGYSTTLGELRAAHAAYRALPRRALTGRGRADGRRRVLAVPRLRLPQPRRRASRGWRRSLTRSSPRRTTRPAMRTTVKDVERSRAVTSAHIVFAVRFGAVEREQC
jgi:hypothetical protein